MFLYVKKEDKLEKIDFNPGDIIPTNTVWIDLLNMTQEEEKAVETFTGINIPSREEMHEIEVSSRLYEEHNAVFMTAMLVTRSDTPEPESHPVTFILVKDLLVTVRHTDSQPFILFSLRTTKLTPKHFIGVHFLMGIIESIIDRTADILEHIDSSLNNVTSSVFLSSQKANAPKTNFVALLESIGLEGDLVSKCRESLVTITRLIAYSKETMPILQSGELASRVHTALRDSSELSKHVDFLAHRVSFLLDATLGMINIEQNAIIKAFSIAAVVLLPPTLIATLYGMNFKVMPELQWEYGYPLTLLLMFFSALFPYLYCKKRKWL